MTSRHPGFTKSSQRRAIALIACSCCMALAALVAVQCANAHVQNHAARSSATAPNVGAYLGTWKAKFHGKVFAILTLREKNGYLEGTLNNFAVAYDKEGNLTDGTFKDIGVSPIISPRFKNGALIFTVAQLNAYSQTTDWSFAVKNRRKGELTENLENQLETPMSLVPKPIPMYRSSAR